MSSIIDIFYLLDFDRCLGHTDKFQMLLEQAIDQEGTVSLDTVRHARQEAVRTGGSFDTASYVRGVLRKQGADPVVVWRQIETTFIAASRGHDMLEPHAQELLDELDARQKHYGILTYGGMEWQQAKLRAANLLRVPHLITGHKEKGRLIAGWQQDDGTFAIPVELGGFTARRIVFLDDKAISFADIPDGVRGIRVLPTGHPLLPVQAGPLPAGVVEVKGLAGAMELLFERST